MTNAADPAPDYQDGERRLHLEAGAGRAACQVRAGRTDLTTDQTAVTCLRCRSTWEGATAWSGWRLDGDTLTGPWRTRRP